MLSFGVVGQAVFVVASILWLREMPRRWRSDLEEFRSTTELTDRLVLGLIWGVTLWLVLGLVQFVVMLALRFCN